MRQLAEAITALAGGARAAWDEHIAALPQRCRDEQRMVVCELYIRGCETAKWQRVLGCVRNTLVTEAQQQAGDATIAIGFLRGAFAPHFEERCGFGKIRLPHAERWPTPHNTSVREYARNCSFRRVFVEPDGNQ